MWCKQVWNPRRVSTGGTGVSQWYLACRKSDIIAWFLLVLTCHTPTCLHTCRPLQLLHGNSGLSKYFLSACAIALSAGKTIYLAGKAGVMNIGLKRNLYEYPFLQMTQIIRCEVFFGVAKKLRRKCQHFVSHLHLMFSLFPGLNCPEMESIYCMEPLDFPS